MKIIACFLIFVSAGAQSLASADLYEFATEVDEKRYKHFIAVLRCPKCQNQNLAGSDSLIATDLKREVYEQIITGRSDKEITDYLVARYGEYILYRPPFTMTTAILWLGPVILLCIGIIIFVSHVRRRRQNDLFEGLDLKPLQADEQARLDLMLQVSPKEKV